MAGYKVKVVNYTFAKGAANAGTVTFTDYGPLLLDAIILITNVTKNTIIYNFADSTKGGTVATNVLTLAYDTSSMANTDNLTIWYWDNAAALAISAASLPLPSNAAQETGGNLATIATDVAPLVASGAGGYVRQDSTATIAKESGGNLATVNTNTAPLVASGAGGYIRQDSTATIAKETGGNLATVVTNTNKIPSLGQALAASSVPVTLTALEEGLFGALNETAPTTDTGSSGLNGRLQRVAQRLASLIALVPTALSNGFFQVSVKEAISLPVTEVDGGNITLGAIADVAVTAGATGSISAKLRSISRDIISNIVLASGSALIGKVGIDQTTPGTTNAVAIAQIGSTTAVTGGVAGTLGVGGNVATNVAIGTNPINLGAQAISSENTAVTATRLAQLVTDLVGKLIVLPYANPENNVSGAITSAMSGTTTTSLIAAPATGLRNYITQITVSNSHATVGTDIIIQDGSGGTTLYTIPAASVYGGATVTFPVALRQPTTATAIFCANVTTGASTKVSASGFKGI